VQHILLFRGGFYVDFDDGVRHGIWLVRCR
jgi:hypothetical protein